MNQTPDKGGDVGGDPTGQTIKPPALVLPKGGGAIRGIGEKFAANPVTGTGSMSIPIATSPGRSGFSPQLSLSYDSGSGNGPFGFGWSLSIPSITRKTDKGLPQYCDEEESDVYILSGAEDLVPIVQPDGKRFKDDTTFLGYTIHYYRPRIEGLFARIERWTNQTTREVHWRSISHDNITTLYGKDNESRLFDPLDLDSIDPVDLTKAHSTRIFSWLICESYDDKGNAIIYEYKAENSDGVDLSQTNENNRKTAGRSVNRYSKRIKYGNRVPNRDGNWKASDPSSLTDWMFEVVFDYGEGHYAEEAPDLHGRLFATAGVEIPVGSHWPSRQDSFSSYRPGFEVRTYRLCRRALMFHHFPAELGIADCLVKSTEFHYMETPVASFIESVSQSGFIRQPLAGISNRYFKRSLPSIDFEYRSVPDSSELAQQPIREVDPESLENLPVGLDGAAYQWMDLDGEGTSGILTEQADGLYYKRNLSANNQVIEGKEERTLVHFGSMEVVTSKPGVSLSTGTQFLDLAGDGQRDLVQMEGSVRGFFKRTDDGGWAPFQPFFSWPNLNTSDPNLRFVDLNGDGHADILLTEDQAFTWYPSLAEDGFGSADSVAQPFDEESAPRLVFNDGTQSIHLADLSGDGLSDLVRIRNGEVCYWPNLGYGHFGAKVTMDNSPWFDAPEQFDRRRIRLADVDGSGTTDLLYLRGDGVQIYFNQSGNRWSGEVSLPQFPLIDDFSSVQALDLLGNGTACLVWSSPLPGNARRPMCYIALMDEKPHLLVKIRNNLGAETIIHYAPSTRFYLNDKQNGIPWITKLPFPVHVVEKVETFDRINHNYFISRYAYHHGYFDGTEREFRGFGMVEQWDTDEFNRLDQNATNVNPSWYTPPVHTKTWFHTGAYFRSKEISLHLAHEYFDAPQDKVVFDTWAKDNLLDDTVLPDGSLTADETREACRSLKGAMLRQEVYADDDSIKAKTPYTITEQNFSIVQLQPQAGNRHAVYYTHQREAVNYHYERNPIDPRVTHALTLDVDAFGNVLKSVAVTYGRRQPDPALALQDRAKQSSTLITYTENRFTEAIEDFVAYPDAYRTPLLCESRTYELTGYTPTGLAGRFQVTDLVKPDINNSKLLVHIFNGELNYEDPPGGVNMRRLIEHTRTLYRKNNMAGFLPLGVVETLALPGEGCKLAFTSTLLNTIYVDTGKLTASEVNNIFGTDGGYVHSEGDTNWWIPSGRIFHSPNKADSPAQELNFAREHFFLPHRFRDAFNNETFVSYDSHPGDPTRNHNLLLVETRDAIGNVATVSTRDDEGSISICNDYRVLQPFWMTDANRNRSRVSFDALGWVVALAVMGKSGENKGDLIDSAFQADPDLAQIQDFVKDPRGTALGLVKTASTRIVYDLDRYRRCGEPPLAATLEREIHASDPGGNAPKIQIHFVYSDGFGRELQTKIQAEAGDAPQRASDVLLASGDVQLAGLSRDVNGKIIQANFTQRWVGTGRTVYNNKGKAIKKYEPFFSGTYLYEPEAEMTDTGVTPILFYDPVERLIATLHPNHTYEKVLFDPWQQTTWDVNDTVLLIPQDDPDISGFVAKAIVAIPGFKTWFDQRIADRINLPVPPVRTPEQSAAIKTMLHAGTHAVAYFDTLGRTFLTVADNGKDSGGNAVLYKTRVIFDIEGNQREVIDARNRIVMRYDYDMLGNHIHQSSMEAGERWTCNDVTGKPIRGWDSRKFMQRIVYDELRRPTGLYVTENGMERLAERTVYGEGQGDSNNHKTRVYQVFDGAGIATNEIYDFKGNLLQSKRELLPNYQQAVDWNQPLIANDGTYHNSMEYDALNRQITVTAPDHSVYRPTFNEANLLDKVDVNLRGAAIAAHFITNINYNAKGQRELIAYGNGATTNYEYDPFTFRLTKLTTTRLAGLNGLATQLFVSSTKLQDLRYTYDPAGNLTRIEDAALKTISHNGEKIEPICTYTYDAIYRLIEAHGREHIGQAAFDFDPPNGNRRDFPFSGSHVNGNDPEAVRNFGETYEYDETGNFNTLRHAATNGNWTRSYAYEEDSLIEGTASKSNRLTRAIVGNGFNFPEIYRYTDSVGNDADGCITRINSMLMTWDFKDQLQMVDLGGGGTAYYVYDAAGQRVRKVIHRQNDTRQKERIYLGGFEIYREYNGASGKVDLERETLHVMDDKQRIALVETRTHLLGPDPAPPQLVRYQLGNHLGSAALELDDQGQVISYEEYHPYGTTAFQAMRSQSETPKRYRYTGKERDEETGFTYHGARYYAPWLGRWISADPSGIASGLNSFEYCHCGPTRFVDNDGREPTHPQRPTGIGGLGQPPLLFRMVEGAKNLTISNAEVELPPTAMAFLGASFGAVQSLIPGGLGSLVPSPAPESKAFETNRGLVQTWIGAAQTYIGLTEAGGGAAAAPESGGVSALAIPMGLTVAATGVVNVAAGNTTLLNASKLASSGSGSPNTPSPGGAKRSSQAVRGKEVAIPNTAPKAASPQGKWAKVQRPDNEGLKIQSRFSGKPILHLGDGTAMIEEYVLDNKEFDVYKPGVQGKPGILGEVKGDYSKFIYVDPLEVETAKEGQGYAESGAGFGGYGE